MKSVFQRVLRFGSQSRGGTRVEIRRDDSCRYSQQKNFHTIRKTGSGIRESYYQFDAVEWKQRCDLAVAYRAAHLLAWDQMIFNHISFKLKSSTRQPVFLINRFGFGFEEVTASNLLKVSRDGQIMEDTVGPALFKQGYVIHSAIHEARGDAKCVWHCHFPEAVAVSLTKKGLLPLTQEALAVVDEIAYHPFEGTTNDETEKQRLVASLGSKKKILMLNNHGPVTIGETVEEAFSLMYFLCRACTYQVKLLSMGIDESQTYRFSSGQVASMLRRDAKASDEKYLAVEQSDSTEAQLLDQAGLMFERMRRFTVNKYGEETIYC